MEPGEAAADEAAEEEAAEAAPETSTKARGPEPVPELVPVHRGGGVGLLFPSDALGAHMEADCRPLGDM